MRIITIFAPYLYAVHEENEEYNAFETIKIKIDINDLRAFYKQYKRECDGIIIGGENSFIKKIQMEVMETFKAFKQHQKDFENLYELFDFLSSNPIKDEGKHRQYRSKYRWEKGILRVYAIRMDNAIIITGSA